MREFKSLYPVGIEAFDATIEGEDPIVTTEEAAGRIRVTYRFPGFYLSDDEQTVHGVEQPFKQVTIAATGSLSESGRPLLPSFGRYVQIPAHFGYEISCDLDEPVEFEDVLVAPAQAEAYDAAGTTAQIFAAEGTMPE